MDQLHTNKTNFYEVFIVDIFSNDETSLLDLGETTGTY